MINLLNSATNPSSKFRDCIEKKENDSRIETYNTESKVKFKTRILKWSLFDYSNGSILGRKTKTTVRADSAVSLNKKNYIYKLCLIYYSHM